MTNGLYIHIPYCRQKCGYCGFTSYPLSCVSVPDTFTDTLTEEMALYKERFGRLAVDTVFIGGGTPSLLRPDQLRRIFGTLDENFDIAAGAEMTTEANPDSLSDAFLAACRECGVNRLSVGIQSFSDRILKKLGRIHDAQTALSACERAKDAGFDNLNLDLMFGLPEQSYDDWMKTLSQAVSLDPAHLSLYTLQIEEGTPFYEDYKNERIDLPPVSLDRCMYHEAICFLREYGYEQYEISNFAKAGRRCRHNEKYWTMQPFIGLGPAAASWFDRRRCQNDKDLNTWANSVLAGVLPYDHTSEESFEDAVSIYCFTALRTSSGLCRRDFQEQFYVSLEEAYRNHPLPLARFAAEGLLIDTPERICLTEKGIDVSNDIMSAFIL